MDPVQVNFNCYPDWIFTTGRNVVATGGPGYGLTRAGCHYWRKTARIAVDAAGVALLRGMGLTRDVTERRIFALKKIVRAAEIG